MTYWLMKSEPSAFSIDDLSHRHNQTEHWDGVRNYQARNMLRDQMQSGDKAFFYHSSCAQPGIVGIIEIVKAGYPDFTAFDPKNKHFDSTSSAENPRWYMVDVRLIKKLSQAISLEELKKNPKLTDMQLLRKGNRLSIMPVTSKEWEIILQLGH